MECRLGPAFYAYSANYLIDEKQIESHVPVWDKAQRDDETLSSSDFEWNEQADQYRCPQGHVLRSQSRAFKNRRTHITKADTIIYRSSQSDCATSGDDCGCLCSLGWSYACLLWNAGREFERLSERSERSSD